MHITQVHRRLAALCLAAAIACKGGDAAAPIVLSSVAITAAADSVIFAGATATRVATVKDAAGTAIAGKTITWTSSVPTVASIDATGRVTARTLGTTQITATADGVASPSLQLRVIVKFATAVGSIAAGDNFSCGIVDLGATAPAGVGNTYCWGLGTSGQLGTGAATSTTSPAPISGNPTFASIQAGSTVACALTAAGAASCWGDNSAGQLGTGTTVPSSNIPVGVSGGLVFTQLSVGAKFACGLTAGGAYCWGDNTSGQLGSGASAPSSNVPVRVSAPAGVTFASISVSMQQQFACAVSTANVAYCWGNNGSGQFGNGTVTSSSVPVAVPGTLLWSDISAGATTTCALTKTGAAYCWGDNSYAQIGDGTKSNSLTPVAVVGGLTFKTLATGGYNVPPDGSGFTCGTADTGNSYCWGDNRAGMLGSGLNSPENVTPIGVDQSTSGRFSVVRLGTNHACAVSAAGGATPAGVVYCWGANANGQLGLGSTTNARSPARVGGQR
jgi:alpha-tubulin suppressor-like RCC1 family protein